MGDRGPHRFPFTPVAQPEGARRLVGIALRLSAAALEGEGVRLAEALLRLAVKFEIGGMEDALDLGRGAEGIELAGEGVDGGAQAELWPEPEQRMQFGQQHGERKIGEPAPLELLSCLLDGPGGADAERLETLRGRGRALAFDPVEEDPDAGLGEQQRREQEIGELLVTVGVGRPVEVHAELRGTQARAAGAHEAGELRCRLGAVAQHEEKAAELRGFHPTIQNHRHGRLGLGLLERPRQRGAAPYEAQHFGERSERRHAALPSGSFRSASR